MISPQYDNLAASSFVFWLSNKLQKAGGYENYSGRFYPIASPYAGYYAYGIASPQILYDSSVSGANVITGVYLNNTQITTGVSGLQSFDYNRGYVFFNQNVNSYVISGHFAVSNPNVKLTYDNDENILFRTKYQLKPKFPQTPTGVSDGTVLFPIVYVRVEDSVNEPFALGGQDTTNITIRCILLMDSLYSLHAVQGVLRDAARTPIALLTAEDQPFNVFGGLKNGNFNYTELATTRIDEQNFMFIEKVKIPRSSQNFTVDQKLLPSNVYFNFADFELTKVRSPRQC